jgi:hypothetical protein
MEAGQARMAGSSLAGFACRQGSDAEQTCLSPSNSVQERAAPGAHIGEQSVHGFHA